ncbi:MAG: hypothetical protein VX757_10660 [Planctomycetota bacterium]|nr:hypothetical protein [Planctomycetota bacterium]
MGSSSPRITLSPQVWLTGHDREFFNRKARQEVVSQPTGIFVAKWAGMS